LKNWHGDLLVGADLTFSERNREVYNAKAKVIYAKSPFKTIFDYDATYGRSEVDEIIMHADGTTTKRLVTKTDANRMNGGVKTDFDLTKKWYVYNLASMGYDEIRKIDLREEIGPGMGYHLIQHTNFFANLETGANYQREDRSDGTTSSTFFFRLAESVAWKITPRLSWDEKFEYLPRVEDLRESRMRFETNFRYALLQNVFVNLSLVDLYDSQPANGVTQNDLQVRSSVGVKF
jgi:putative salt-induced outer membrane protein YdiY